MMSNMPSIIWVSSQIGNNYTTTDKDLYDCCHRVSYHSDERYQKLLQENKQLRHALTLIACDVSEEDIPLRLDVDFCRTTAKQALKGD